MEYARFDLVVFDYLYDVSFLNVYFADMTCTRANIGRMHEILERKKIKHLA